MIVRSRNVMVTIMAVIVLAAFVSAQITFSRDWTGGKRAAPLALDCNQFARLCRHFLHEMKSAMSSGLPEAAAKRRRVNDDGPPMYEDE